MLRLHDSLIKRLAQEARWESKRIEVLDHKQKGLRLRITPTGEGSWSFLATDNSGRSRWYLLGCYPDLGLNAARRQARSVRAKILGPRA